MKKNDLDWKWPRCFFQEGRSAVTNATGGVDGWMDGWMGAFVTGDSWPVRTDRFAVPHESNDPGVFFEKPGKDSSENLVVFSGPEQKLWWAWWLALLSSL
jgi:hypothetical protein